MSALIRSVDLKLARADSQVRAVAAEIAAWCSQNPLMARCELLEGQLGFRLILEEFTQPAPLDDWGLLIGECVHNLRSALDNLAFALARLHHDPPRRPRDIAFPIFEESGMFGKKGRVKLNQMTTQAASLIERLQPFQRNKPDVEGTPETDALVLLQWLNNADKHRVPSVVLIAPKDISHSCRVEFYSEDDAQENVPPDVTVWAAALHPGVVLLEQRTNCPVAKVSGSYYGKAIVAMSTLHGRAAVPPTLGWLSYYTALVVNQFRGFFK